MIGGVSTSSALDNRINSMREERKKMSTLMSEIEEKDSSRDECQANQFHFSIMVIHSPRERENLNQP